MSTPHVSDQAVQAAARTSAGTTWDLLSPNEREDLLAETRRSLEAAVPHLETIKPTEQEIAGAIMGQGSPEDAAANVQTVLPGRTETNVRGELARQVHDAALARYERHGNGDQRAAALVDVARWLRGEAELG